MSIEVLSYNWSRPSEHIDDIQRVSCESIENKNREMHEAIYRYKRNDANRSELSKLLVDLGNGFERRWYRNFKDFFIERGNYHVTY